MVGNVVLSVLWAATPALSGGTAPTSASHTVDPEGSFATDALDTPQGAIPTSAPWAPTDGLDADRRPAALGDKVLFINFDGVDLQGCGNDSPLTNCSTIWNGAVDPYTGDAAKRAAIVQIVRQRVEDVGITVTDRRPETGDYDMEVVGNWSGVDPSALDFAGVAPSIDCFDNRGGETSFTLEKAGTSDGVAEIILQELAHTWGLEHVDDQGDLLYPTTQGTNKTFRDECLKIVRLDNDGMGTTPVNGQCNAMHTNYCEFGWQNSAQELLALFGPSVPDTVAPSIEILSPSDGATLEGGDVELVIAFDDDQSPQVINTTITIVSEALEAPVDEDGAYASPAQLTFPLSGLPDGDYVVTIDGHDESDNPTADSVTFTVVGGAPAGTSGTGGPDPTGETDAAPDSQGSDDETGDGNGDGDGSGTSGGDAGGDTQTDSAGADASETDTGCGCASGPNRAREAGGWLSFLLLAIGNRPRRRSDSKSRARFVGC